MTIAAQYREVPRSAVDLEDHPFSFAPPADLERLLASIAEVGLLAPPWLRPKVGEKFQVIAGRRRCLAVTQLGWERLPARVLPADAADSFCLLVSFYDNAFTRGFNPLEQARLAGQLLSYWDRSAVTRRFLPLLGQPPAPGFLDRLLAVLALEEPLQALVAEGRLALIAASRLAEWDPKDRLAVAPFLENLPLSQSKQEELLEGVGLLARREGTDPEAILGRPELRGLLGEPGKTPQERAGAMRRQLHRWLFPQLSRAEADFAQALSRLGLSGHPRLSLKPPPAFEGPDFELGVKFRNGAELQNLLEEIARLTAQEEFSALTRL
jgi:ParB-like chromosome segregation protein Spo0J